MAGAPTQRPVTGPDLGLVRRIRAAGGGDVKKCYQCATCSVVCRLSPADRPFPRKEMAWAQWGLGDRLVSDPDVWLCHRCDDCTTRCPRGARPGDVMNAIRSLAVEHYSVPKFMGRMVTDPRYAAMALLVPAVLVLAAHWASHGGFLFAPTKGIVFSEFLPHIYVNLFYSAFTFLAIACGIIGVSRFWKDMRAARPPASGAGMPLPIAFREAFLDLLLHRRFRDCESPAGKTLIHVLVIYGFMGLFVVTGIVVIMLLVSPGSYPIMSLAHPLKIAGNAFGASLFIGCTVAIYERVVEPAKAASSPYFDWLFLLVLYGVAISGLLTEAARFAAWATLAYPIYFSHLVLVFALLVYLPWSKLAHALYRFAALTYARHAGIVPAPAGPLKVVH